MKFFIIIKLIVALQKLLFYLRFIYEQKTVLNNNLLTIFSTLEVLFYINTPNTKQHTNHYGSSFTY